MVPALYNLSRSKALPEQFALIGVARSDGTADSWRERLHDMLKSFVGRGGAEFNTHIDEDAWARLADAMTYILATLISMKTCAPLSTRPKKQLEGEPLDTCRALGIAVTACGVLARGRLGGHLKPSFRLTITVISVHGFKGRTSAAT